MKGAGADRSVVSARFACGSFGQEWKFSPGEPDRQTVPLFITTFDPGRTFAKSAPERVKDQLLLQDAPLDPPHV